MSKLLRLIQLSLCAIGYLSLGTAKAGLAQVTSDDTVNTQVNQNGNVAEIVGGATRGSNLFHSFQDFSVPAGNEAFFNNADSISNIFSRVTGGNISNIDGLIRANGSANLFLINPNGIIFGQNASLNLGGSFYGSSASSVLFEDGEFSANLTDNSILKVNPPIGLNFRDNPGTIINSSTLGLYVRSQETLALLGGNVSFDGGVAGFNIADDSQIGSTVRLGGLSEPGAIALQEDGSLDFPQDVARGDVALENNALIFTTSAGEGAVFINARNFDMNSDARIANGILSDPNSDSTQSGEIAIDATEDVTIDGANSDLVFISNDVFTTEAGSAGKIAISAKNISFLNGGFISSTVANTTQGRSSDISLTATEDITLKGTAGVFPSSIGNLILSDAEAEAGKIEILAQNLAIAEGAYIDSSTTGKGDSSNIDINIKDTVSLDGSSSRIVTQVFGLTEEFVGVGNAGNINLSAQSLTIDNGGRIATDVSGLGNGGNIRIDADNITLDGTNTEISSITSQNLAGRANQSNAGNIAIATNSLSITNRADINTSTASVGDAGDINITASDRIFIDGGSEDSFSLPSNIRSDVEIGFLSDVAGNSGNVKIATPRLTVTNGGIISASTLDNGNAGNLTIRTSELLEVSNNAFVQADVFFGATGTGGNLNIETPRLIVRDGGTVSASTFGNGNAGNLNLNVSDSIEIIGETDIATSGLFAVALNSDGNGGQLNVVTDSLRISDGGLISVGNFPDAKSTRSPGTGAAGNINIRANSIDLENGGNINAATQSSIGNGANIALEVADLITLSSDSLISARAVDRGNGGNLAITTDFIIAFAEGNNDIIASAEQGRGGNIIINAESLLGIEERPLDPLTNDINASSEVVGLDGTVNITAPDLNPIQGSVELPTNIVVPQETSVQACQADREVAAQNGFSVKGKGGIIPEPKLPLNSLNVYVEETGLSGTTQTVTTSLGEIQLARGIRATEDDQIILTAYRTNNRGDRLPHRYDCF